MLEVDLRLSAEPALGECCRLGIPGQAGTIELNEWQNRVWVKVHPLRAGGWAESLAQELASLEAG